MKKLMFGLLLVLHLEASSYELQIQAMRRSPEMDHRYRLKNSRGLKVILDCQSFVQGLSVGDRPNIALYLMEPYECEELRDRLIEGLRHSRKYCLDLDDIIRSDYPCN